MGVEVGAPLAEKFSEHSKLGMEISWVQYASIKGTLKKKDSRTSMCAPVKAWLLEPLVNGHLL